MPDNSFSNLGASLQRALPAGTRASLGKWAPRLLFVGFLILAAWLAARLTWQFLPSAASVAQDATQTPTVAPHAPAGPAAAERIAAAHLFGVPAAPTVPGGGENAPETSLDLTLIGVAAGTKGAPSQAIIASGGNHDEATYPVGATLPGGATIRDILPDRVVLAHTGRLETLRLPQAGTAILAAGMSFGGQDAGGSGGVLFTPAGSPSLPQMPNPASFSRMVRLTPYVKQGKVEGYTVYPGADPELFTQSGLKPGDVVISINGESGSQIMNQLPQMRGATGPIHLVVLRQGHKMNITVNPAGGG